MPGKELVRDFGFGTKVVRTGVPVVAKRMSLDLMHRVHQKHVQALRDAAVFYTEVPDIMIDRVDLQSLKQVAENIDDHWERNIEELVGQVRDPS